MIGLAYASGGTASVIRGRVTVCNGGVVRGAIVTLATGESQVTDADGAFVFRVADTATVEVTAELAGLGRAREIICVPASGLAETELLLPWHVNDDCIPTAGHSLPNARRIKGRVESLTHKPIRGAIVRLLNVQSRAVVISTRTNRRGQFRTRLLPLSHYAIEISSPNSVTKSFEIWSAACLAACERPLVIRLSPRCI